MKVSLLFCLSYIFWPIVEGMAIKMRLLYTGRQGVNVQPNDPAFWPLYKELVDLFPWETSNSSFHFDKL
jgi:hypothetical protein